MDHWQVVQIPSQVSVSQAIARSLDSGLFESAEPDYYVHAAIHAPNDPEYQQGFLWALHNTGLSGGSPDADIDALEAWNLATESEVTVAIIDSGVRITHEDLAGSLWINPQEIPGNRIDDDRNGIVDDIHGFNAMADNADLTDTLGHGTHIAGIIGAIGNNGVGTVGVAWCARLMSLKFLNSDGEGTISDAVKCLDYARAKGARIVTASWVDNESSQALLSALRRARSAGMIVVAAAGNTTADIDANPVYPPAYDLDNIVTVAATTRTDALASFSNYGRTMVHLGAPGVDIFAPWKGSDDGYAYYNGTSMAAPFVASSLALLWGRRPDLTVSNLIQRLLASTDPVPSLAGKCRTGGRLNLHRFLAESPSAAFTASPTNGPLPLTVAFREDSVGSVTSRTWNFGDGSPESNELHPQHTYTNAGTFAATLTILNGALQTSVYGVEITAVANYEIAPSPFAWIDPAGMTRWPLADNEVSPALALPFVFSFYGRPYTHVYVAANGLLGFTRPELEYAENTSLPYRPAPNAIVCPYWDDLNPALGGAVQVGQVGNAPTRKFVVAWTSVPLRAATNAPLTFQVILEETTQAIGFQYLEVQPGHPRGGGRRATVGIENETGLVAAVHTIDGIPHLLENRTALVFRPAPGKTEVGPIEPARLVILPSPPPLPFALRLFGESSRSYRLEGSHNLLQWLPIATNTTSPEGQADFVDPHSPEFSERHYRSVWLPR
jgi:PKD repeat protein